MTYDIYWSEGRISLYTKNGICREVTHDIPDKLNWCLNIILYLYCTTPKYEVPKLDPTSYTTEPICKSIIKAYNKFLHSTNLILQDNIVHRNNLTLEYIKKQDRFKNVKSIIRLQYTVPNLYYIDVVVDGVVHNGIRGIAITESDIKSEDPILEVLMFLYQIKYFQMHTGKHTYLIHNLDVTGKQQVVHTRLLSMLKDLHIATLF